MAYNIGIDVHAPTDEAPAKYVVRGYDDILWTDDPAAVLRYVESELSRSFT